MGPNPIRRLLASVVFNAMNLCDGNQILAYFSGSTNVFLSIISSDNIPVPSNHHWDCFTEARLLDFSTASFHVVRLEGVELHAIRRQYTCLTVFLVFDQHTPVYHTKSTYPDCHGLILC